MFGFASKLISTLSKRTSARPPAARQRAALALEPLEMRAVFSTAAPIGNSLPSAPVVDLQLDRTTAVFAAHTTDPGVARTLTTGANVEPAGASRHPGGANFAFADGHVHFVKDTVPTRDLKAPGDNMHEPPGELPVIAIDNPADDEARRQSPGRLPDTASEVTGPNVHGSAAQAAARWEAVITGDLPDATFDSEFRYVPVRRPPSPLGDGSVRPVSYGISPTTWNAGPFTVADDVIVDGRVITGENWNSAQVGGGRGAGKVAMQDIHFSLPGAAVDPIEDLIIVGGPQGHVKVFDGTSGAEIRSFFAYGNFNGGVYVGSALPSRGFPGGISVAAGDIGDSADDDNNGHGTHVAGTNGAATGGTARPGAQPHIKVFSATGIDYSHPDLYKNIWINQSLERIIDDLASDVAGHDASRQSASRH